MIARQGRRFAHPEGDGATGTISVLIELKAGLQHEPCTLSIQSASSFRHSIARSRQGGRLGRVNPDEGGRFVHQPRAGFGCRTKSRLTRSLRVASALVAP